MEHHTGAIGLGKILKMLRLIVSILFDRVRALSRKGFSILFKSAACRLSHGYLRR